MDAIKPKTKIKPLIGFRIDVKCQTKLGMKYLARDRPKMISRAQTDQLREGDIANKEVRELCKTFRDLKSSKKIVLDLSGYEPSQMKTLSRWVKTLKNLNTLKLSFPWGGGSPDEGLFAILFHLKEMKKLKDLTLYLVKEESRGEFERLEEPCLKLRHLPSLKRLKILSSKNLESDPMHNVAILDGLKKLRKLFELDLDVSLLNLLPELEIQRSMRYLKKDVKNLRALRLDSRQYPQFGNIFVEELASYLSSLKKLESFHFMLSIFAHIKSKEIQKLVSSVKNNPKLENLVLLTAQHSGYTTEEEQLKYLNLNTFNQLISLKLSVSGESKTINNRLLQDTAETLKRNRRIETLNLDFSLKPLTLQGFKLFCGSLLNLKNLTNLDLSLTSTLDRSDKEHIRDLTASLKTLKKLENLSLSFRSCGLSSKSVPLIAETVDSLQGLKSLFLDFSFPPSRFRDYTLIFKKTGIGSFGSVFQRHKSLSKITLLIPGVNFIDKEFEELALGIGALKTLKGFELSSSQICPSLSTLYQGLATNPALSCLNLKLTEMKHQDLEILFGTLQFAKNLESLQLDLTIQSLSDKAIENFKKMIQGLVSLRSMDLEVHWGGEANIYIISKFLDGMKCFDRYVDCSWKNYELHDHQKRQRCENVLDQNHKYLRYLPSPVRYRYMPSYKEY